MERMGIQALAVLALAALVGACEDGSDASGEIELFDGATLAGWTPVGDARWQVVDGALTTIQSSGDGMLVSDRTYGNYRLTVEFWVDDRVNSGVLIGCSDPVEITPFTCHEVNIWDNHPNPDFRTGSIVAKVAPPRHREDTAGQWNLYDIAAQDGRIVVTLNGVVTAELDDPANAEGYIALQSANGGIVRFRRVALEPSPGALNLSEAP